MIYWTDWNRGSPKIEKAYMDGTHREVMVGTDLGLPNGLALDVYTNQLCWGDAGEDLKTTFELDKLLLKIHKI